MNALIFAAILSILSLAGFVAFVIIDEKYDDTRGFIFVMTVLIIVSNSTLIAAIATTLKDNPTAMDVYQGKTTLEYTVVDNVITDSTVIFRKEDL